MALGLTGSVRPRVEGMDIRARMWKLLHCYTRRTVGIQSLVRGT